MNRLAQVIRLIHIRHGPRALKEKDRENKGNLGEYSPSGHRVSRIDRSRDDMEAKLNEDGIADFFISPARQCF